MMDVSQHYDLSSTVAASRRVAGITLWACENASQSPGTTEIRDSICEKDSRDRQGPAQSGLSVHWPWLL